MAHHTARAIRQAKAKAEAMHEEHDKVEHEQEAVLRTRAEEREAHREAERAQDRVNPGVPHELLDKVARDTYGSAYSELEADEREIVGAKVADMQRPAPLQHPPAAYKEGGYVPD